MAEPERGPRQEVDVVGARRSIGGDLYHLLLRQPWWIDLALLAAVFLLANFVFAAAYLAAGGVAGAHGLLDHFFFSVQTMGTIGYGQMHPRTGVAEALVTLEVLVGVSLVALATGIMFAKFSVPRARMQFASSATVSPFNGMPMLMFRVGNERPSQILEAVVRVVMLRTERTDEGVTYYRMRDLVLERDRSPALARSWTVMHRIDEASPLFGATPQSLVADEVEFILTVVGIDETSAQNLHARYRYDAGEVRWGMRHADMLSERRDGTLRLDMSQFDRLVPTRATATFPYPSA